MGKDIFRVCPYASMDENSRYHCHVDNSLRGYEKKDLPCTPSDVPICAEKVSKSYLNEPLHPVGGYPAMDTGEDSSHTGSDPIKDLEDAQD